MNILGVDPSLTATAFCGPSDWRMYTLDEEVSSIKRNEMRLIKIRRRMIDLATHADLVVIEGFSYGSKFKQHDLGGLGWILRLALWENQIPYAVIPPTKRAKYATGNGRAGKLDVFSACIKQLDLDPKDDNQSDAAWLRAMGLDAYDRLDVKLPKAQRAMLKDVEWPEVNGYTLTEILLRG